MHYLVQTVSWWTNADFALDSMIMKIYYFLVIFYVASPYFGQCRLILVCGSYLNIWCKSVFWRDCGISGRRVTDNTFLFFSWCFIHVVHNFLKRHLFLIAKLLLSFNSQIKALFLDILCSSLGTFCAPCRAYSAMTLQYFSWVSSQTFP